MGRTDACDDDNRGPGNAFTAATSACADVKVGSTTVDLPLTGDVVSVPANTLRAGTFRENEVRISQVRLTGTFDGQAFDVAVPVNVNTEIEFETRLVVADSTPTTITASTVAATKADNGATGG